MIKTYRELVEIAQQKNRLDESSYYQARISCLENEMLIHHIDDQTLMGFFAKYPILRRIKCMLRKDAKDYSLACSYSEALLTDFQSHTDEYRQSFELLSDEWSRQLFVNLLAGEMRMDGRYGIPFQQCRKSKKECKAYYCVDLPKDGGQDDPFIQDGEIFVDCGAFTGDTLQELINEGVTPKKYIGFEPDPDSFIKAQRTLFTSGVEGIVHNAGAYNSSGTLQFSRGGYGGKIAKEGDISINILSMDNVIKEPVTLIKMDIEGSEYEALEGGSSLLKSYKPKLAICIYHKPTDYRKIPLLIKQLNADYTQFYIRYLKPIYNGQMGFVEVVLFVR